MTGSQQKVGTSNGALRFGNATARASCAAFRILANHLAAILSLVRGVVGRFHCRVGVLLVEPRLRDCLIRGIDLVL